ncbi:MAG: ABC transporter permease [Eubacteriales bacterium]|jgi:lipoprotein-releasing system permease protein|nr:ABC transporter permease [Eubacteriales bacterium]
MLFELKIALRFMRGGRAQTVFIASGIAIGVAVMIFLGLLITSLQASLVDQTIGNSAHITLRAPQDLITRRLEEPEKEGQILLRGNDTNVVRSLDNWTQISRLLADDPRITALSPSVQGTAFLRSGGKDRSVQMKGVDLQKADAIYEVSGRLTEGSPSLDGSYVLIGTDLAHDLDLAVGDALNILVPSGESTRLLVGGIFDLESEAVNASLIFMDLSRAQKLFNIGNGVSELEIQVRKPFDADLIAREWSGLISDVRIQNWKDQNAQLLSALSSQGSSSYTIQFFVILSITFGISSVLAVSVVQKSKEIGIMKAMGVTKKSARRIFVYQGLILGVAGAAVGIVLGVLLLFFFNRFAGSLTINYNFAQIAGVALIAVAASTLASVIPARRSAEMNPMEAIKNG